MGIAIGAGAVFGVLTATRGNVELGLLTIFVVIALAVLLRQNRMILRIALASVAACCIGITAGNLRADPEVPPLRSAASPLTGVIVSDPKTSANGFTARLRWRDSDDIERSSTVFLPPLPETGRGDRVELDAEMLEPSGELLAADVVRVTTPASRFQMLRRDVRGRLGNAIERFVPGAPSALALGLLIGDDSGLSSAERDDLRNAGLSHITAVSGWNVTLVVSAVGMLFVGLRLRGWHWTAVQVLALAAYVWLVGADPPVVRAALMCVAVLGAAPLGRPAHGLTLLSLSAGIMACVSPSILGSLSFQLSFFSMAGLLVVMRFTSGMTRTRATMLGPLLSSVAAGLATAPLLAFTSGSFTLATVPANIVAGPLVSAATFVAVGLVALSWLPPVATLVGWGLWAICALVLGLARVFAAAPIGHWQFAPLSAATAVTVYLGITLLGAAVTPEGRAVRRTASRWAAASPGAAAMAGACAMLVLATTLAAI